jgi:hypothetical protein
MPLSVNPVPAVVVVGKLSSAFDSLSPCLISQISRIITLAL